MSDSRPRTKPDGSLLSAKCERCPSAAFYRTVRDEWMQRYASATSTREEAEAGLDAMETLYAYFLSHGLIERDPEPEWTCTCPPGFCHEVVGCPTFADRDVESRPDPGLERGAMNPAARLRAKHGESLFADSRRRFFKPWPLGAPIEGWAEYALSPSVRCLARYVLHLEQQLAARREASPTDVEFYGR